MSTGVNKNGIFNDQIQLPNQDEIQRLIPAASEGNREERRKNELIKYGKMDMIRDFELKVSVQDVFETVRGTRTEATVPDPMHSEVSTQLNKKNFWVSSFPK